MSDPATPAPLHAAQLRFRRACAQVPAPRALEHLVRPGDVALDIGAAEGVYTAGMLSAVGPAGAVHAFEPHPRHLEHLRAIAGDAANLTIHEGALSDRDATVELMVPTIAGTVYAGMGSLVDPRRKVDATIEVVTVTSRRLDDVLAGADRIDFVKIDVEGHEDEVLDGATELFTHFRPAILIEIEQRHRTTDLRLAFERLLGLDLDGYALFDEGLRPIDAFDVEADQLRHVASIDPSRPMPAGYVGDFLFVRPGTQLDGLVA